MFYGISALNSIDFSNFKIDNINTMSYMFYNCSRLKSLNGISKINTNNVNDISYMFYNCNSLEKLPDISKWKTGNVTNISNMFFNCNSLTEFPDISDWETNKIYDMSYLFSKCSLLTKIPDISKWDTSNLRIINDMFPGCLLLASFPKIINWDIRNVVSMDSLFLNCKSLRYEHEISEWLNKITELNLFQQSIFQGCDSLILPKNTKPLLLRKINNFFYCLFKGFCYYSNIVFLILWCLLFLSIFSPPFFLIYYSLNLDRKKNIIINPLTKRNFTKLINYTDFTDFVNLTNYTSTEEITEFCLNQKILVIINIILSIISILFIIVRFLCKREFLKRKYYYITIITFIFFCFLFDILDKIIYSNLYNITIRSIEKLEKGLQVKLRDKHINSLSDFGNETFFNNTNFCIHFILLSFIILDYNKDYSNANRYSCGEICDKSKYENLVAI